MYTYRATPSQVYIYLSSAQRQGIISGFEQLKKGKKPMWLLKGLPRTRYDEYHHPESEAHLGQLLLTSREVLVFTEGWWAGKGINPVHRAGQNYASPNTRRRWYRQAQAERDQWEEAYEADEEDDGVVDVTDQRALPPAVEGTAEEVEDDQ